MGTDKDMRTVVKERELRHAPEKVWRALTQKHLVEEWLMKSDFKPEVGHRFDLEAAWGRVSCEVLAVEPHKTLSYSWAAHGLESVVTWTLTKTAAGTHLKMEQTGFGPDQEQAYRGARAGWEQFLDRLEKVIADLGEEGAQ
ncbi:SRPBCC domain-containing protein [Aliiroseovarius sp. Z3]|uniref:SRPBCC family protein n=1 Tax=Aliiroseovarius sp. Z3 TaxID=2811402 RepID=UPI0023B25205|nr:SRPBCC domain-containing protein [Aliiroseovarius sp. Z3]MDE9449796.1 SRPBCC domain-containing protein [Aliiroseovarius sp. Z3]